MPGRSRLTAGHHAGELALIGCAALAWYLTYLGLSDMSTGPGTMGLRLWGFLAVWTLMMAAMMLPALSALLAENAADIAPWVGAGVLVAAGAYQLTPLKDFCLRHCRSPIAFLLHVSGYKGRLRDVRVGIYHGVYCVGCCWGAHGGADCRRRDEPGVDGGAHGAFPEGGTGCGTGLPQLVEQRERPGAGSAAMSVKAPLFAAPGVG